MSSLVDSRLSACECHRHSAFSKEYQGLGKRLSDEEFWNSSSSMRLRKFINEGSWVKRFESCFGDFGKAVYGMLTTVDGMFRVWGHVKQG